MIARTVKEQAMTEHIKTTIHNRVMTIRIDRLERRNALTHAMYAAIADAFDELDRNDSLRAAIITGTDDIFTAGNDLMDFAGGMPEGEAPVARFLRTIVNLEKPLLAAVNGPAVGVGLTMLLHCDIAYAAQSAKLSAPFVKVGVVPEAASSVLLPRSVGMSMANEIMMAGRVLTAQEAYECGLVSKVVADEDLLPEAQATAERMATLAPTAMKRAKGLMRYDRDEIAKIMAREAELFNDQLKSAEFMESTAAFMQKRAPNFP